MNERPRHPEHHGEPDDKTTRPGSARQSASPAPATPDQGRYAWPLTGTWTLTPGTPW